MFDPKTIAYDLPEERIAKRYPAYRSAIRLLIIDRKTGKFLDRGFGQILDFIGGDICYANNCKLNRPLLSDDLEREPVYARAEKSSIIPSAGNAFEQWMVDKLDLRYVTLTAADDARITTKDAYQENRSAAEFYDAANYTEQLPVTMIGTTAVKAIESSIFYQRSSGVSDLLILPGFKFKATAKMLTNFHYPKEILLAMTCAFGGVELMMEAYAYAMRSNYNISDRGDRMLII